MQILSVSVHIEGLTFVFTGKLKTWKRSEVKLYVEHLGGRAISADSGETDYVVAGPGSGSKKQNANENNVTILNENEFKELVEERTAES